jgi:hypothetical protein
MKLKLPSISEIGCKSENLAINSIRAITSLGKVSGKGNEKIGVITMKITCIKLCAVCRAKFRDATLYQIKRRKIKGQSVGRPRCIDSGKILKYAEENPRATQRAIAQALEISVGTVNKALRKADVKM